MQERIRTDAARTTLICVDSFCDSVLAAIGEEPMEGSLDRLDQLQAASGVSAPRRLSELRGKAVRFEDFTEKDKMEDVVLGFLK